MSRIRIGEMVFKGGVLVSTVKLSDEEEARDLFFSKDNTPPGHCLTEGNASDLFETAVFNGFTALFIKRYATAEEAAIGHAEAVRKYAGE